jgi:hypothetical protein
MGRRGGDERRLQAHEVMKKLLKELVLTNSITKGGSAFPSSGILTEPPHLRSDKSRPGDIMALGRGAHRLNIAMYIVVASSITKSCLSSTSKSSDYVLKAIESSMFGKVKRYVNSIAASSTMRFIPLTLNHFGMRSPPLLLVISTYKHHMHHI